MPERLTVANYERINLLVSKEKTWFDNDHNKIRFLAKRIPVLVLGDHPKDEEEIIVMDEVIKKLRELGYSAIPLKEVSQIGNHIHNEREAMKRYQIIIKLEHKDDAGAGAIGENVLIAGDKQIQEKAFLFVKESDKTLQDVFSIKYYFLYFPRIYFCKNDEDMIDKAIKIVIRETFRLVYVSIGKTEQSQVL